MDGGILKEQAHPVRGVTCCTVYIGHFPSLFNLMVLPHMWSTTTRDYIVTSVEIWRTLSLLSKLGFIFIIAAKKFAKVLLSTPILNLPVSNRKEKLVYVFFSGAVKTFKKVTKQLKVHHYSLICFQKFTLWKLCSFTDFKSSSSLCDPHVLWFVLILFRKQKREIICKCQTAKDLIIKKCNCLHY